MNVGHTFNESEVTADLVTSRRTRRLTRSGIINNTPTYHLNACFSGDSRYLVLASEREDGSAILRADVETGELAVLAWADKSSGIKYGGGGISLIQATGWVVAKAGRSLRLYNLHTFEERTLLEDPGPEYNLAHPIGSPDGARVIVPRIRALPPRYQGERRLQSASFAAYVEAFGGMPTTHLEVDIATGEITEVFHEEIYGCNHVQPCPADPDLWLIDRDSPPKFSHGGDGGHTTRAWLFHAKSRALTELRPRDDNHFQVHTNWSRDGRHVYYHNRSHHGGHYIGVADHAGNVVWEHHFPLFHYGHVSTHTQANAIVVDSVVTPDLVTALFYEDTDSAGVPRMEILARHGSLVNVLPGQQSHPHCHMSPDGRWLSYNRGEEARADVYVVQLR